MTSSIDFLPTILQFTNSYFDSKNEHDGIDISSIFQIKPNKLIVMNFFGIIHTITMALE